MFCFMWARIVLLGKLMYFLLSAIISLKIVNYSLAIVFHANLWRWIQNIIMKDLKPNFISSLPSSFLVSTFRHCLFTPAHLYNHLVIRPLFSNLEKSSVRPCPHVYGYFRIRNFFVADSKISPSTRSVFKSYSPVHTYPMVSGFTLVPKAPLH